MASTTNGNSAYARVPREVIQNAIRTSECLTEQVYWLLILMSYCGPHVRKGCFLRDENGFCLKDENGNEIPARQKDVCRILKVKYRGNVSQAIRKLVADNRLEIGEDGIWYPVFDPSRLAELLESVRNSAVEQTALYLTHCLGIRLSPDLFVGDPAVVAETVAAFRQIQNEYEAGKACLLKQHRMLLKQAISARLSLVSEEIDEIEETTHTPEAPVEPDSEPVCVSPPPSSNGHHPDPPVYDAEVVQDDVKVHTQNGNGTHAPERALVPHFDQQMAFEAFWSQYSPLQSAEEAAARDWWRRNVRTREYALEIIAGLNRQKQYLCHRGTRYIPHAVNFLSKHRYRDKESPPFQEPAVSKREQTMQQVRAWAKAEDAKMGGPT